MNNEIILNILNSNWIKFIYGTGWVLAFLVTTKTGNKILTFFKHIFYWFKNPPIIYSASFDFDFLDINAEEINNLVKTIYKSEKLSSLKLVRNGQKYSSYKLHYPGIDYEFNIEEINENTKLLIKLKETESNYNNLNRHIKNELIYKFMRELVLVYIQEKYTTSQYTVNYQFNLKFSEMKYNFFLKERFTQIPKGYVSNALVTIKDVDNSNFFLEADLNGLNICVNNNLDMFVKMIEKYISII